MKKILYFSTIFISLLFFSHFFYYLPNINNLTVNTYLEKSKLMREMFLEEVKKEQEKTTIFTYLIGQDSRIIESLKTNQTENLNYDIVMDFLHNNGDYKDIWFQIISKEGNIVYRSWSKTKNDNILSFREDLKELVKNPKPTQAITSGISDLVFVTTQPVYDRAGVFIGFIELISHFNSVANTLKDNKIEPLFILSEEKSAIITEPFTNIFLGNNYIANLNASKDILNLVQEHKINNFIEIENFISISQYLATNIEIKDVEGKSLGLFLMFLDKKNIDYSNISNFQTQYLTFIIFSMIIYAFIFLYLLKVSYTKELKAEVSKKTQKINDQQRKLKSLITIYDKNVIFSKTDLQGFITHASSAFCDISGYTKEELIGKPHNIVRHPDMPKEFFKDMWKNLKEEKRVTVEIKNLRKDGSYYWVIADLEPEYDEKGTHIGYFSVREDITANKEIEELQRDIIFTMGSIAEVKSKETSEHVKRVAKYSRVLANALGLSEKDIKMLELASPMHDIGKIAIPDEILHKPAKLTFEEFEIMKTHAEKGYEMLHISNRPLFKVASQIALTHHEKYDGTGYPNGLKGEDIPIFGRITAIVDVFDAIASDRCYKKAWEMPKVLEYIKSESGKQFDPKLVDLLFENIDKLLEIKELHKDG
ncbi:response regulator receiver protein [Arcobacter sp. FW59]|nr:response regulator receiver protein [Arcobacter sp. FW59]